MKKFFDCVSAFSETIRIIRQEREKSSFWRKPESSPYLFAAAYALEAGLKGITAGGDVDFKWNSEAGRRYAWILAFARMTATRHWCRTTITGRGHE